MRGSTSENRAISRWTGVVVLAVAALLAVVLLTNPGSIALICAVVAAVTALVATWLIRRDGSQPVHAAVEPHDSAAGTIDESSRSDAVSAFVVSLARRNGGLVDQQLALLDTLEANVEDPVLLANYFKLDHLATRMRRYADSLLVLAGVDRPGLRSPQDIDEVIRAGISEIEDYARIDVLALEHVQVTGLASSTLGHLVAELLDNATAFSAPEARVRVAGNSTPTGYEILVADSGVGITSARLDELNGKLGRPPELGATDDSSIGLTVVSMLAARIGARVSLSHSELGGTVATVVVPASAVHIGELGDTSPTVVRPLVEAPLVAVSSSTVLSPAAIEAANAVARLNRTISGLPIRSTPTSIPTPIPTPTSTTITIAEVSTAGRLALVGSPLDGSIVCWPPPNGSARPNDGFPPPPPPLRTALGPLQVAESRAPRPVVEAHAETIGAALSSFARQRRPVWDAPAVADRPSS